MVMVNPDLLRVRSAAMWRQSRDRHPTSPPATPGSLERRDHGSAEEFIRAEQLQVAPQGWWPREAGWAGLQAPQCGVRAPLGQIL